MDWKAILGAVAPTAATLLISPFAGLAVEALGSALSIDAPTVKKVQDALTQGQLTGDQVAQIKQAELALTIRLRELDISVEQIAASDRDSARKREVEVRDKTPALLAAGVTIGFFGILAFLLSAEPPDGSRDVLNIMLGSLGTAWVSIVAYYFGSSSGSARKSELLAQAPAVER